MGVYNKYHKSILKIILKLKLEVAGCTFNCIGIQLQQNEVMRIHIP